MNDTLTFQPPGRFVRRVLLSVSGLSPQVITETLFALGVLPASEAERFVPTEVHALTTTTGADRIRSALWQAPHAERAGGFHRLCADYGLAGITFGEAQVHLVHDGAGRPLDDIRTEDDNARMADAITGLVRSFTGDPDCALHVSLAGGRKTMGYYAGYALSLFGRVQDRLSHVLVSEGFESHPDFYYPTPRPEPLALRGGGTLDAQAAQVRLASIPFVRLRDVLPADMLAGGAGFAAAVQAAARRVGAAHLVVDRQARCIQADGQVVALAPWPFALVALLAWRRLKGLPPLAAPLRDQHDEAWAAEVLGQLRMVLGEMQVPGSVDAQLRHDATGNKLGPHWSRLRKQLASALGPGRAGLYFDDGGTHKNKRYQIPLLAEAIEIR